MDASRVDGVKAPQYRGTPRTRHDHFDIGSLIEAVHLVQQLQQDALDLPIGPGLGIKPLGSDGVDLVNKYYCGSVLPRQPKDVADHARPLAQVLLDELRTHH